MGIFKQARKKMKSRETSRDQLPGNGAIAKSGGTALAEKEEPAAPAMAKPEDISIMGGEYFPIPRCADCVHAEKCPMFDPQYECGYAHIYNVSLEEDYQIADAQRELVQQMLARVSMRIINERNSGNMDETLDEALFSAHKMLTDMRNAKVAEAGTASGGSSKGSAGIIAAIFGDIHLAANPRPPEIDTSVIDVQFDEKKAISFDE